MIKYQKVSKYYENDCRFGSLLSITPQVLKYCDTVDSIFDYIEISFTDQNGRPLQIDNHITVSIIIKKSKELKKASKRIKNAASKFNQSKYGKISKTQRSEFGKIAGKK